MRPWSRSMLTERMFEKMMVMVVMIDEGSHVTGLWEAL
jgi:hypothetical protein